MTTLSRSLFCPRCRQQALTATEFAGYTIDLCPRCRGLWCLPQDWQQQAWGKHPDHQSLPDLLDEERAPDLIFAGQSNLRCPECARPLTILKAGRPAICEIDQCDHCGGIWFDHPEWEHLSALRAWPAALQKLEAAPTAWNCGSNSSFACPQNCTSLPALASDVHTRGTSALGSVGIDLLTY